MMRKCHVRFLGGRSNSNDLLLPDKAAQLLYGDEVGGAIVPEEEGDFLTQLARDVLSNNKLTDLTSLFAEGTSVSSNPAGTKTTVMFMEPVTVQIASETNGLASMMTWDEWIKQHGVSPTPIRKKPNSSKIVEEQRSLF